MSVARHPRPPELVGVPIEEIMQKYVGRFREKKPDWAAFEDAKIEGYKRAQHRFIGAGGSGKHGDTSVIPAKNFTLSIMYVEPGQGNAAHTHEAEECFFVEGAAFTIPASAAIRGSLLQQTSTNVDDRNALAAPVRYPLAFVWRAGFQPGDGADHRVSGRGADRARRTRQDPPHEAGRDTVSGGRLRVDRRRTNAADAARRGAVCTQGWHVVPGALRGQPDLS